MSAVIYTRVSTQEQVGNHSLDTQEQACIDYCAKQGLEVARVFREEGASARTVARPELQQMLKYCRDEAGHVDTVVVYRLDRFSRSVADHHALRAVLSSVGLELKTVQESFDETPAGKFMENVIAAVAQFDNDLRAARTRDGMAAAVAEGRWIWPAPFGYRRGETAGGPSLIPDDERARAVRRVFEATARGAPQWQLLRELERGGVRTRRGGPVTAQTLGRILRNPIYKGRVVSARLEMDTPGDFEPLVSEELFDKVQAALAGTRTGTDRRVKLHPDFPLRRHLRCANCGKPLTGSWSTGRTERYAYYRCPGRSCGGASVRKEELELKFEEYLGALAARPEVFDVMAEVVTEAVEEWAEDRARNNSQVEKRLEAVEHKQNRLFEVFVYEKAISREDYDRELQRLRHDRDELRSAVIPEPQFDDLDRVLSFSRSILRDLPTTWRRLGLVHRDDLLKVVFPKGLTVRGRDLETASTPLFFGVSDLEPRDADSLAARTGFEPVPPP